MNLSLTQSFLCQTPLTQEDLAISPNRCEDYLAKRGYSDSIIKNAETKRATKSRCDLLNIDSNCDVIDSIVTKKNILDAFR